jgi:hypothetical protein
MDSLRSALGSKDSSLLHAASAILEKSLKDDAAIRGKLWLETLIERGYPLRTERDPLALPADGGLLRMQLETETHAFAIYSLARALAGERWLDLAGESSVWNHGAVNSYFSELSACGFMRSKECPPKFWLWMAALGNGTPLFGDDFRTDWSFYCVLSNEDLVSLIKFLEATLAFVRTLPESIPNEAKATMKVGLSEQGKSFAGDLSRWLTQIQSLGQDAFIMWW